MQRGGTFLAGLLDGSCRAIAANVDEEVLTAYFEYNDGRKVNRP